MRRTAALVLAVPLALAALGAAGWTEPAATSPSAAPPAAMLDGPPVGPEPAPPDPAPEGTGPGTGHGAGSAAAAEDAAEPAAGPPASEGDEAAGPTAAPSAPVEDRDDGGAAEARAPEAGPAAAAPTGPLEDTFVVAAVPTEGSVVGTGRLWRYTIEVEPVLGVDVEQLAAEVRAALTDDRSWVRTRTLQQVDDPEQARIRVVLASPDTVDELCGRVGLRTNGIYSCWNGRFAALNSWRWEVGADGFPDITTYRNYLVNHEFGHGLGYGHVGCPAPGAPAPVMMQQSMRLGGCVANGWPYP